MGKWHRMQLSAPRVINAENRCFISRRCKTLMRYCNHIKSVRSLTDYRMKLVFDDGFVSELDFAPFVGEVGGPMRQALKDLTVFRQVSVDGGVLTWPNGYDICSDVVRFWCEQ